MIVDEDSLSQNTSNADNHPVLIEEGELSSEELTVNIGPMPRLNNSGNSSENINVASSSSNSSQFG